MTRPKDKGPTAVRLSFPPQDTRDLIRLTVTYGDVRRYGVRGSAQPPPEYVLARAAFLDTLDGLRARGVSTRDIAGVLGVSRSAVSQWIRKGGR